MELYRRLSHALGRLADHQQGQDIERRSAAPGDRRGADYSAILSSRSSHGAGPLGLGR